MELDILAGPLFCIALFMLLTLFWHMASRTTKPTVPYQLRRINADNEWETICTFRNQSPDYAWGFECGVLYERMQRVYEIHETFHHENKAQILDFIRAQDWTIVALNDYNSHLFELHMVDNVTPQTIIPFPPPQDGFDPPVDWTPEADNEGEGV